MAKRYHVEYRIPLVVVVEEGEVVQVVVDDSADLDNGVVYDPDTYEVIPDPPAWVEATITGDGAWPAWDFGF